MPKKQDEQLSDREIEERMERAIRRSFAMPHKPHKEMVGTTPRARASKRKAAKGSPKSQ